MKTRNWRAIVIAKGVEYAEQMRAKDREAKRRQRRAKALREGRTTRPSTIDRVELERREEAIYRPCVCRMAVGR